MIYERLEAKLRGLQDKQDNSADGVELYEERSSHIATIEEVLECLNPNANDDCDGTADINAQ